MITREVGKTIVVTIPKKYGVEAGKEFRVFCADDGSIALIPKRKNIFYDENFINTHQNQLVMVAEEDTTQGYFSSEH